MGICLTVHVTRMGKVIKICRILYHNSGRFSPFRRHSCSSKNNIKTDLKDIYLYRVKWHHLAQDRAQFWALFNTIIRFRSAERRSWSTSTKALRVVEGEQKGTQRRGYNWTIPSLGDINRETWSSKLTSRLMTLLCKRNYCCQTKAVKTGWSGSIFWGRL